MNKIQPTNIPVPKGHYSPAVEHNGLIFVSGQLPWNYATGEVETGAIELQTELALRNVENILHAANSDLNHVLSITIYVSEMELWDRVNEVYKRILGEHKPSRAIVPVKELHFGTKIEIQAVAMVKG
ncbi:MAG TPA: RidA family protein [Pyrinomonadaceae bacterium]|nr:RidA family protein [Pyrinomonadaceae bacterium]